MHGDGGANLIPGNYDQSSAGVGGNNCDTFTKLHDRPGRLKNITGQ